MQLESDNHQRLLNTSLDLLDLSTRTNNCIQNYSIKTVEDLQKLSANDILRWSNAGRKVLAEIREMLGRLGLKLDGDILPAGEPDPRLLRELDLRIEALSAVTRAAENARKGTFLLEASPELQRALVTLISDLTLSVRARNILHVGKLTFLGEVAQLSRDRLMHTANAGRKTALELSELLEKRGLILGMKIPDWSLSLAKELNEKFREDFNEERIKEGKQLLSKVGPDPRCLEEELFRIANSLDVERNAKLLMALWGWSGQQPRVLESVGQEYGLTRERVRQIEARALRRLSDHSFETPFLRSAISILRKAAPCPVTVGASEVSEKGIAKGSFSPLALKKAAEIFNISFPVEFVSVDGLLIVAPSGQADNFRKALPTIRRRTSDRGCINLLALASELKINEKDASLLRILLEASGKVYWLDEEKEWLLAAEASRNRLFNLSAKVLGVASRIHVSELRRAVSRSRRLSMCPPQRILRLFVEQQRLGSISDGWITSNPAIAEAPEPESAEGIMISVLRKYGPVLEGEDFAEKCVAAGMNATTHYIYRLISPVISSLARGIFCAVGDEIPPGTVEEILSRRRNTPAISDHGWTSSGKLWFGTELTLQKITAGGVRLAGFVSDFVQGEWTVTLPDNVSFGLVNCRETFIWPFRKVFGLLGAEAGDLCVFVFDLKARTVLVRIGGPDLFESVQDDAASAKEIEEEEKAWIKLLRETTSWE